MADSANSSAAGGFLPPHIQSLPSPAPTTTSTTSTIIAGLPHPRTHALRPGSAKEDQLRNFVSDRMEHVSRRFLKKSGRASSPGPGGDDNLVGYTSMAELCKDLDEAINIIWLSGTPNLQVPFLLNIASEFNTWVAAFPPSPPATFAILHKLDHCFASLLSGEDIETHEPLPGFENGLRAGMSRTDMVRCRSLVEQGRVVIVDVMSRGRREEDGVGQEGEVDEGGDEEMDEVDVDAESGPDGPGPESRSVWDEDEEGLFMDVARVYENTLVKLGDTLGEPGVGVVQMSAD